jgi:hypothetical protein
MLPPLDSGYTPALHSRLDLSTTFDAFDRPETRASMVDSGLHCLEPFWISKLVLEQVREFGGRKTVGRHPEELANSQSGREGPVGQESLGASPRNYGTSEPGARA